MLLLTSLTVLAADRPACAQGTVFTYQGSLESNGSPANGAYDLQFTLFDAAQNGNQVGAALINSAVTVNNGAFTTTLDFGPGVFTGPSRWLGIGVRASGGGAFTPLAPLQQFTPAPYAIFAETSGTVGPSSVAAAQLNTAGAPAGGQVLSYNGSSLVWANPSGPSSGWSLTGNAGTTGANFLGTTDNQPLELRVNNERALDLYQGAGNATTLTVGSFAGAAIGGQGINVLGGGAGAYNTVYPNFSTIAGGFNNTINSGASGSVIAGGQGHVINGATSAIGGGFSNTVNGLLGAIPGGANNLVSGDYGFAAGNSAQAVNPGAFVWADNSGGAFASTANNQFSVRAYGGVRFVTGGAGMTVDGNPLLTTGSSGSGLTIQQNADGAPNLIGGSTANFVASGVVGATIGGGGGTTNIGSSNYVNSVRADFGTVGGGQDNTASGNSATVAGGNSNIASGDAATVGGGVGNNAGGDSATIPGGEGNSAIGNFSFAAGHWASANNPGAFVWADSQWANFGSTANDQFSVRANGGVRFVTGGAGLTVDGNPVLTTGSSGSGFSIKQNADGAPNLIGGSPVNFVESGVVGATIGGGGVGVGYDGTNHVNSVIADFGTVGGGLENTAGGWSATVGGGFNNTASGTYATIPGGHFNRASGYSSFAAGQLAQANNQGAFVWADSQYASFASTANDQFCIRAQGGVQLDPGTSLFCGSQVRQSLNLYGTAYGIGVQTGTLFFRSDGSYPNSGDFSWFKGGSFNSGQNNPGSGGQEMMRLDHTGDLYVSKSVNANFNLTSDRNMKSNFAPVDAQEVLAKVSALSITAWNFKNEPAVRHLGPMAQDFYAAFNVGPDDKHIAVVDENGVALAAIQGLNRKVEEQLKAKDAEIQDLKARLEKLERVLEKGNRGWK